MRSDDVNVVRPVRKPVYVFLDMTTYEQLKKKAILSKKTIARMAGEIISSSLDLEEKENSKL